MNIAWLLAPDFSYAQLVAAGLTYRRGIYNTARSSPADGGVGFSMEARNRGRADCKLADTIGEEWGGISRHAGRPMQLRTPSIAFLGPYGAKRWKPPGRAALA